MADLTLNFNALTSVPSGIGDLTGLTRLELSYNQLTVQGLPSLPVFPQTETELLVGLNTTHSRRLFPGLAGSRAAQARGIR